MNRVTILGATLLLLLSASFQTQAQNTSNKLFENWNTGGCDYTDSSSFELRTPAHVDQIDVWYHWRGRESSVPYTISHDGQTIRTGILYRAECDPNQEAWCVARGSVDIDAGPGAYMVRTERPRVCQNSASAGVGFVKVFGQRTRRGR